MSVVGHSEGKSQGMRRGVPANLDAPAKAIDQMLGKAEQMGGYDVNSAFVGIGGSSVASVVAGGTIAFNSSEHEVNEEDLARIQDAAISNVALTNREILSVTPLEYALDGQTGIKDPLNMAGSRLELRLSVVSALTQVCENLRKETELSAVQTLGLIPGAVAAAKAVLTDEQKENGVAVVDLGAMTTSMAIYEEGDLQYVGVIPAGSQHITNDLATILRIDLKLAEEIKVRHISCDFDPDRPPAIRLGTAGKNERFIDRKEAEGVVKDRLDDIFERVRNKLRAAHYDQRLPEGIVLTGGGARLRDLPVYAREALEASVKIGVPAATGELGGVADGIKRPEFAVAVGLALIGATENHPVQDQAQSAKKTPKKAKKPGFFRQIFSKL